VPQLVCHRISVAAARFVSGPQNFTSRVMISW
jgi:hypothetical protein